MEPVDLVTEALACLRKTTISYPQWVKNVQAGKYTDPLLTNWGRALDDLQRAEDALRVPAPSQSWQIAPLIEPVQNILNSPGLGLNVTAKQDLHDIFISVTGDTGVLFQGGTSGAANSTLRRVTMVDVAKLNRVSYGKHAIYGKAAYLRMEDIIAECSPFCASGFSLRYHGAELRRFSVDGAPHCITYYETSDTYGWVTVEQGFGTFTADTAIWMDAELDYQTLIRQQFTFYDLHFTGPGSFFLKVAPNRMEGKVRIQGCTLNGLPVTAEMVAGVPAGALTIM